MKKYRCPYCQTTFEELPKTTCPKCGKSMMIPGRLRNPDGKGNDDEIDVEKYLAERQRARAEGPSVSMIGKPSFAMIALALMVVVGALLLGRTRFGSATDNAQSPQATASRALRVLRIALEQFCVDCGRYPTTEERIESLILNPGAAGWAGPYVKQIPCDPWRRQYQYRYENGKVIVFSMGADGVAGTADDMVPPPIDLALEMETYRKWCAENLRKGTGGTAGSTNAPAPPPAE